MFLRERLAFSGNALQIRCLVGFDINVIRAVCAARQTIHRNCGKSTDAVKFTTRAGRRLSRSSRNSRYSETNSHARAVHLRHFARCYRRNDLVWAELCCVPARSYFVAQIDHPICLENQRHLESSDCSQSRAYSSDGCLLSIQFIGQLGLKQPVLRQFSHSSDHLGQGRSQ
jgi:hypothetical protein